MKQLMVLKKSHTFKCLHTYAHMTAQTHTNTYTPTPNTYTYTHKLIAPKTIYLHPTNLLNLFVSHIVKWKHIIHDYYYQG